MIELCQDAQQTDIVEYIGKDYFKCLYLYIDLMKYGCKSKYTRTWLMSDNSSINAIILSYHSALHIYSRNLDYDRKELCQFIRELNPSIVCASSDIIKSLACYLKNDGYSMEIGHIGKFVKLTTESKNKIEIATSDDIYDIANLLYEDDDIGASYTIDDLILQLKERLSQRFVRSYVIKENRHVVAHLGTGAEIDGLCTICYVITDPQYRGRGFGSSLFSFACTQLEAEGREIYSVYYPENSRRLHHKMGFVDCCEFGKLFKNIH